MTDRYDELARELSVQLDAVLHEEIRDGLRGVYLDKEKAVPIIERLIRRVDREARIEELQATCDQITAAMSKGHIARTCQDRIAALRKEADSE